MAIPDYQSVMRPLLEQYADGVEHPIAVARERLADQFALSEEERTQRLPSGLARTFNNRVGWAATYLYRVGLLERPAQAVYRITERGRDVLNRYPDRVDLTVLAQFPEYAEFRKRTPGNVHTPSLPDPGEEAATPEERMDAAYHELRESLAADLLESIHAMPPAAFEDLVLDVLHAMGYGDGSEDSRLRTGGSGDAGIDGVIRQDQLGLDGIYVQAKRWEATVGRPVVQAFIGALQGAHASRGVIVTASAFSAEAQVYADTVSPRVVLIDGARLAELMIDHGVGVSARETYVLKKVDTDYFGGETGTAGGS